MVFTSPTGLARVNHDFAGLGASVVRDVTTKKVVGTFFKFWLRNVKEVFVLGTFNGFNFVLDENISDGRKEELRGKGFPLTQLSDSGYWYGYTEKLKYSSSAPKDNEYIFFVINNDGKADFVADPIAKDTVQRNPDINDAIALVVDWESFEWKYDKHYARERKDFRRYIIYQLHWGTFFRPEGDLGYEKFNLGETTTRDKRFAVAQRLKKISAMGFTAIELLPIHEANGATDAGYNPSFFFAVESAYGTPEDLRILVDEAHKLGLAVIFDVVVNHLTNDDKKLSSFTQPFVKGYYSKENAPWSNHRLFPGQSDWGPDPDFDRPEIRNIIFDCIQMYFSEYHIDGIRLDATTTIPRRALKEIVGRLREKNDRYGKFISAEHITDDPFPYIIGDIGCHAGWDKGAFYNGMNEVIQPQGKGSFEALRKAFETNYNGRPETAIKYMLGSHDEIWQQNKDSAAAAINRVGGPSNAYSRMKMRLAWALNTCAFGIPMMFMGTEYMTERRWHSYEGYNAGNEDANGKAFAWEPDASSSEAEYMLMVRDINNLRSRYVAMRNPNRDSQLVHFDDVNGVYAYKRWDGDGNVFLITINISDGQWQGRDYQFSTNTPNSSWKEVFNSQYVKYGGWTGSGNSDSGFNPKADVNGLLQGINLPKWSLMVLKQQ